MSDDLISKTIDYLGNGMGGTAEAVLSHTVLMDNTPYMQGFIPDADWAVRVYFAIQSLKGGHENEIEDALLGLLEKGYVDAEFDGQPIDYERAIVLRSEGVSSMITFSITDAGREALGDMFGDTL